MFEPERIVAERRAADGTVEYRIRWAGYAPAEDTWEPAAHLLGGSRELLRELGAAQGTSLALRTWHVLQRAPESPRCCSSEVGG